MLPNYHPSSNSNKPAFYTQLQPRVALEPPLGGSSSCNSTRSSVRNKQEQPRTNIFVYKQPHAVTNTDGGGGSSEEVLNLKIKNSLNLNREQSSNKQQQQQQRRSKTPTPKVRTKLPPQPIVSSLHPSGAAADVKTRRSKTPTPSLKAHGFTPGASQPAPPHSSSNHQPNHQQRHPQQPSNNSNNNSMFYSTPPPPYLYDMMQMYAAGHNKTPAQVRSSCKVTKC